MNAVLFHQLLWCAIITATDLFVIQMIGGMNIMTALTAVNLSSALIPTFFYCKLSENITADLGGIDIILYGFVWYQLPLNQQKLFLWPIQRAQREVRLTGLGIFDCSLPTFLWVKHFFLLEMKSFSETKTVPLFLHIFVDYAIHLFVLFDDS